MSATFLALIAGAFGHEIPAALFQGVTASEWTALFEHSRVQGVMALAWEGVRRLPAQLQPPRALKMNWALNAEQAEEKQRHRRQTALEAVELFARHDIRAVILKGISLDHLYPAPCLRESCDVDLYLPDAFEQANRLLAGQSTGKMIDNSNPKHTVLQYKGVVFENHQILLDTTQRAGLQRIEAAIMQEIQRCGFTKQAEGYYVLPPAAGALFLLRHMSRHFVFGNMSLRQVLDYGLFLRAAELDPVYWNDLLARTSLAKISDLFLKTFDAVMTAREPESPAARRIAADMMNNGLRKAARKGRLAKLIDRMARLWCYRLLPDTIWDDVIGSWLRKK